MQLNVLWIFVALFVLSTAKSRRKKHKQLMKDCTEYDKEQLSHFKKKNQEGEVLSVTPIISETIQYANIGESVILICKTAKGAENLRWLRANTILTDGRNINKVIQRHTMFKIDVKKDASQYNLMIANVSTDDFRLYFCEMQICKHVSRQGVTLLDKDFLTSTTTDPTSREFQKRMTEETSEVSVTRSVLTTFSNTERTDLKVTITSDELFNSGLLTLVFIGLSCLFFGCIICMSFINRKGDMPNKIVKQQVI